MKRALLALTVFASACGPLTPQRDGGTGGGGGNPFFGGGIGGGTGAGTTGGANGGGGGATGGGATGGGTTGGGGTATGGGGGLAPLTWAAMGLSGATSTSYIIGLSGSTNDLWAIQDTGHLFHSTGGVFTWQFAFQYGAKDLYASGGTVVMIQTRSIRTCTSGCTQEADFQTLDLLNSGMNWNLFGEALCGRGPNQITAVVSDTQDRGQLFEWNGSMWTRTNSNLPIDSPRACWFDSNGGLYIAGEDAMVFYDQGAATAVPLSNNFTIYYGGAFVEGSTYVVGPSDYVARGTGSSIARISMPGAGQLFHAVGGLRGDEVFAVGYYTSTNGVGNGLLWNGTQFRPLGDKFPGFGSGSTGRVVHVTTPNEIFIAGGDGAGPLIARGRR
ncbi:MAG: hypothetical protein JNM17_39815 [Archangium sp.]|nr:hypothetical protein [Archangium sp.]